MWMTPLILSRQNHSSPIWSAQLISSQLCWLPQRCTDQLILGALWQRPLISSKNKKKDRGFWPWFRCYELPTEQSRQGLFPHQSIHWYSFYLHSYNSDHLQASSVFSIDPCLVPTITRLWSWPSPSYWCIERKIQQPAILQAPMPFLPKISYFLLSTSCSPLLFFFSVFFSTSSTP